MMVLRIRDGAEEAGVDHFDFFEGFPAFHAGLELVYHDIRRLCGWGDVGKFAGFYVHAHGEDAVRGLLIETAVVVVKETGVFDYDFRAAFHFGGLDFFDHGSITEFLIKDAFDEVYRDRFDVVILVVGIFLPFFQAEAADVGFTAFVGREEPDELVVRFL